MRLRNGLALVAATSLAAALIQAATPTSPAYASSTCPVSEAPTNGTGTSADPWQLASPGNVQWLRDTGSKSAHYELTASISMAGCTWTSGISQFSGTFAGQGFTIDGLSISSGDANVGFFRAITGTAVVSDLGLTNLTVLSTFNPSTTFTFLNGYIGAIAGDSTGRVEGSFATGSVTARYTGPIENSDATYVGGLVGRADQSPDIAGSWFAGQVAGGGYSGGLVGYLRGATINDSSSSGNVSGAYSGGLVGRAEAVSNQRAVVQESFSAMNASGDFAGGLIGRLAGANVVRSLSTGNAAGTTAGGGIAATIDSVISLFDTMSTGNVTVTRSRGYCHAGGLLGRSNVSNPTLTIARSFALGSVSNTTGHNCGSSTYLGPLMSSIIPSGKITQASFYVNEVTGGHNTAGTKVTQSQLQDISTYNSATPAWTNTSSGKFPIATVTNCGTLSDTHWSLCPSTDPFLSSIGLLSAPGAPTSLTGSGIDGGVRLTWSAPSSTGGTPIVGYAIESSTDDANWATAVSDTRTPVTTADITGLDDGTAYYFRAKAITAVGLSSASTSSGSVTAGALPSPPLNVEVSGVRSTEIDLNWSPPRTSGASAILDYRIEYSIGESSTWTIVNDGVSDATSHTVTDLANGGIYRFRVSAKNSLGWSLPSDPTDEQYVGDVPEAPTNVRIGGWSRTGTTIAWQTPAPGSTPITGFEIEYSSNGGVSWITSPTTYAANATFGAVENLVENQEYDFRVLALNAVGPSSPSSTITHVVGLLPSSPRNVTAVNEYSNTILVRWDAPSDPGSSPVSSYRIDYSDDGGRTWTTRVSAWSSSSGTNVVLSSWPGGKTYTFRVYARNNSGENPTPGQGGSVVIGTVPSAPARPTASAGDRTIELTWQAPDTSNTFPVTGYTIQRSTDSGVSWNTIVSSTASTSTSYTDSGLINGMGYRYRVAAINSQGSSSLSLASATATPASSSDFVSTWTIANNGDTITLPLSSAAGTSYNFTVAWGDGTSDTITAADLPVTHTYANAGSYSVRISGTMRGWSFAQVPISAGSITDVSQWGNFAPASGVTGAFRGARNLDVSATDAPDLSFTNTLADFFRDASSLTTPALASWDTSSIVNMDSMFFGASSFNRSLTGWDTSSVQDMDNFLRGAVAFEQDLGSLDVTSLQSASGFLAGVELTAANYQSLLVGWAAQGVSSGVSFDGGSSTWAVGDPSGTARAVLTGTRGWTIVDGGGTPGAPVITGTTPTSGAIGLTWSAPANDGDRTITDYEYSLDGGTWTSFNSSTTSGTITGLTDGRNYAIRVRAVNSVGAGVASSVVDESPASAQPSAPSSITVTRGNQALTLDFVVTFNGGSDITSVEYSLDNGASWGAVATWSRTGSSFSATVTGLTNGTEYSINLRVSNASQTSPASPSVTGTPATAPAQPTLTVTPGNGAITVDANGAQDSGGLPIDYYEYQLESGPWTRQSSLPFTISDLAPGTYTIDVRAASAAGTSMQAQQSVSVTVDAPGNVVGLVLVPGDSQILVSWQPADGDVTDYEISLGSGWQSLGSTATSTTLTDLTNGMLYSIQVRAMNFTVAGPESDLEQATPGVPGAVSELNATAGEERITLAWTAPEPGASVITNYEFSLDFGSTWIVTGSGATRYEITGLTAGANVTVVLRAGNRFGFGLPSSGVSATPLPIGGGEATGLPSAPEAFTITPSTTSAILSWEPPADPGATPVTGYEIGYYLASNPVRPTMISVPSGNARTYTVTGLTAGEEYQFLLSAVNDAGVGPTSSENVTVGDLPGAPTDLTAEPGNGSVTLSWTAGSSGSSAIFDYEYTINEGVDWTPFAPTGTTGTVTDLMNGTDYQFQVRAVNSSGPGPASDSVVQRAGVPRAPSDLQTTVEQEAVELQWTEPDAHGLGVTGYEITVSEVTAQSVSMRTVVLPKVTLRSGTYVTTSTTYTLTGLSATGSYRISVRAINNYGSGQAATTTVGLEPGSDGDEWVGPAPHIQQFAAPTDATVERCESVAPMDLNWSGVPSGGWGVSWAPWVNDGRGGIVCTRTLIYDRRQAQWVLAS